MECSYINERVSQRRVHHDLQDRSTLGKLLFVSVTILPRVYQDNYIKKHTPGLAFLKCCLGSIKWMLLLGPLNLTEWCKDEEQLGVFISTAATAMAADPRVQWPPASSTVPVLASGSNTGSGPVSRLFLWHSWLILSSPLFHGPACFLSLVLQASHWFSELLYILLMNPFSA